MKYLVWFLVALLVVLHQDNWFWTSDYNVLGFMPVGLFYHACLSVAASIVWYLATLYCWPTGLEEEVVRSQQREEVRP